MEGRQTVVAGRSDGLLDCWSTTTPKDEVVVTMVMSAFRNPVGGAVRRTGFEPSSLEAVVEAAAGGCEHAWENLVGRFSPMVMSVARSYRLNEADVAEVHQTAWLRLVQNIDRIGQPDRVGAWLATTARRECFRVLRGHGRMVATDQETLTHLPDDNAPAPAADLIAQEQAAAVRAAYAELSPPCRRLLGLLSGDEPPSYKEVSALLSMPIGSIGPTRGRCLEHLRRILAEHGLTF